MGKHKLWYGWLANSIGDLSGRLPLYIGGTSLPVMALASLKNLIAFYHIGIYANSELLNWLVVEYPKYSKRKLDMGKYLVSVLRK